MRSLFPSPGEFEAALKNQLKGFQEIRWVERTGSTNTDLVEQFRASRGDSASQPTLPQASLNPVYPCLLGAHTQSAGKGRAGRAWTADVGACLLFSCAFKLELAISDLVGLPLAIGIGTCEALRDLIAGLKPNSGSMPATRLTLKWPNDLQWDNGKLAGILIETAGTSTSPTTDHQASTNVVIGIGLNLREAQALSEALGRPVADWATITEGDVKPIDIVTTIARAWVDTLKTYTATGFTPFQTRFDTVDALAGQTVDTVDQGRIIVSGTAHGVDQHGQLLVKTSTGVVPVLVGDTSVRRQQT